MCWCGSLHQVHSIKSSQWKSKDLFFITQRALSQAYIRPISARLHQGSTKTFVKCSNAKCHWRIALRSRPLKMSHSAFTLYPVTSSRAKTKQLTAPSPVAASDYVLGARAQTVSCIFKIEIPDVNTKLHNDTANTLNSAGGLTAALDSVYGSSGHPAWSLSSSKKKKTCALNILHY